MIVHQYLRNPFHGHSRTSVNGTITVNDTIVDIYNNSCLNGWSCGNIAIAPIDAARFHWDLHHGAFISNQSLHDMMDFDHGTTQGWDPQPYGLGMMKSFPSEGRIWEADPHNVTFTVGHAGQDYGSSGTLSGYNIPYEFGIALFGGSQGALNCSNMS